MDKHINNKHILMAAAVAAVLGVASCSQDGLQSGAELPNDGRIMFTTGVSDNIEVTRAAVNASVRPIELKGGPRQLWLVPTVEPTVTEDRPSTRGTQLNRTDKLSSFGVSAFKHNAETYDLATCTPDYFYNLEATEIASSDPVQYQIAQNYYWPKADEALTFNAYYPYGNDNVELTDLKETAKAPGEQSFTVKVPSDVRSHVDFMTARAEATTAFNATAKPSVSLKFEHKMTAVRFVLGDQFVGGFIKTIAISGIYSQGIYTINSGWVGTQKGSVSISYETNTTIDKEVTGTPGQTVTDGTKSETFLLIPQTFGAGTEESPETAKISIRYWDGKGDCLVEASLAGQDAWLEGTTVTYAISSKDLSTLRISNLGFPETVEGAPKTDWEAGDAVGLYVVSDGINILHENVKCEYVGGTGTWKWRVVQPVVDGVEQTVYYDKDYDYYFYYPYDANRPAGYPLLGSGKGAAAENFFSGVILERNKATNSTYDNQGSRASFLRADLQVAKGVKSDNFSTVTGNMARQVTMAVVTLGSKTLDKIKTYKLSTDDNYTFQAKTGTETVTASAPTNLLGNDGKYYFYAKWNTDNQLSASGADTWSQTVNIADKNGVQQVTVSSPRTFVDDGTDTYTMAVGDVYFTDGSLGKSGTAYPQDSKTPAGIVFALNADMSTADKTTNGFTHGYVFSLKDANAQGAGHQWYKEASGDVSGIANVTWNATLNMETTENVIKNINGSGQNGYSNTQAVGTTNGDYPAFQAVGVYNTTTCPITATQTNSGWYLPSIAEWWLVCKNLGNMNTGYRSNDTGWHDGNNSLWGVYYNNNSANSVHAALNTALSKAGSKGAVYNPIQGGSAADTAADMSGASPVDYWSSSEWSGAGSAFCVSFYISGNLYFSRYTGKSDEFRVRPVLAF